MKTVEALGRSSDHNGDDGGLTMLRHINTTHGEVSGDANITGVLPSLTQTCLHYRLTKLELAANSSAVVADGGAELAGAAAFWLLRCDRV